MAHIEFLTPLSQFGLNPKEWALKSLRSEGEKKCIWYQCTSENGLLLKGRIKEFNCVLNLERLEIMDT